MVESLWVIYTSPLGEVIRSNFLPTSAIRRNLLHSSEFRSFRNSIYGDLLLNLYVIFGLYVEPIASRKKMASSLLNVFIRFTSFINKLVNLPVLILASPVKVPLSISIWKAFWMSCFNWHRHST